MLTSALFARPPSPTTGRNIHRPHLFFCSTFEKSLQYVPKRRRVQRPNLAQPTLCATSTGNWSIELVEHIQVLCISNRQSVIQLLNQSFFETNVAGIKNEHHDLACNIPSTWPRVLHFFSSLAIIGKRFIRLCQKLGGLKVLLSLHPETLHTLMHIIRHDYHLSYTQTRIVICRNPKLLLDSDSSKVLLIRQALHQLNFPSSYVRKMITYFPFVLNYSSNQMLNIARYLRSSPSYMSEGSLLHLLRRCPWIFSLDLERQVVPNINWLDQYISTPLTSSPRDTTSNSSKKIKTSSISVLLASNSNILNCRREHFTLVRLFFTKFLMFDESEFIFIIKVFPPLLSNIRIGLTRTEIIEYTLITYNEKIGTEKNMKEEINKTITLDETMANVVSILHKELTFSIYEVKKCVKSFPAILSISIHKNIYPVLKYFKKYADKKKVSRLISKLPPILGYSLEDNVQPKMNYLIDDLKLSPALDVLTFPGLFSYSLKDIIVPRTKFLSFLRIEISSIGLSHVVSLTDELFCERVAKVSLYSYQQFQQHKDFPVVTDHITSTQSLTVTSEADGTTDSFILVNPKRIINVTNKLPFT